MNGIPPLLNKISQVMNVISLVTSDVAGILGMFSPPMWGIYSDGEPIIIADSLIDLSFRADSKISTYPQQKGGFQSYNKVHNPFDIRVNLTKGGTDGDRTDFLQSIEDAKNSFELYQIVTPEKTYENVSITHYEFRRTSTRGVSLLTVEIWAEEVRDTASVQTTSALQPESNNPVNGGNVQAQDYSNITSPGFRLN